MTPAGPRTVAGPFDLASIREAAGLSRRQVAEAMGRSGGGASASNIKAMEERQGDWKISGIAKYVEACDGTAELVVRVNGETLKFDLT